MRVIAAFLFDKNMATLVSDFRDPTRAFLGDFNATVRKYQDSAIDSVVRTTVKCGIIPGFAIANDTVTIVPDVLLPADYARITYRTCIAFVRPNLARYSYDRRAMKESFGGDTPFLLELENALYDMENGAMFSSFQNFSSWATAITGIDVWAFMTDMLMRAPVATVSIGRDGVKIFRS